MSDRYFGEDRRAEKFGEFSERLMAVDKRLTEHIENEGKVIQEIFTQLKIINDTLSQATGARKILVWIIATIFASIALAKGWLLRP